MLDVQVTIKSVTRMQLIHGDVLKDTLKMIMETVKWVIYSHIKKDENAN